MFGMVGKGDGRFEGALALQIAGTKKDDMIEVS
jgi:hypothetical protein